MRLKPQCNVLSCAESESRLLEASTRDAAAPLARAPLTFQQLYRRHFDDVMRLVLRFGLQSQDAEDVAQRVFLIAHRQLEGGTSIEQPAAFLRAIAIRIIREHFRWWRVRRAAQWLVALSWAGEQYEVNCPERDALAAESLEQVRHVLGRMSNKLREALVLLDIEELTPREAAALLGVPQNTLRSRRALAREEFKRLWDRPRPQPSFAGTIHNSRAHHE